jgi:phospholipid N-methyltransferase
MLEGSGWTPKPKPKTKADLPLLNYGGKVSYRNPYSRGEIIEAEAQAIAKAEWSAIHADYKGTRVSGDGSHRVRTALLGSGSSRGLRIVYLTDAKQHARPTENHQSALDDLPAPPLAAAPRPRTEPTEQEAAFEQVRSGLKAGIEVVSVAQLIPTPPPLAARMAALAELRSGDRVLEPSAGTGNIVRAILGQADQSEITLGRIVAVEVNGRLAASLAATFAAEVSAADFLTKTAEQLGGPFDRVVMNPPFAHGADIKHVLRAIAMLAPGGRLVAVVANGPKQHETLRPLVDELGGTWEPLPGDTFVEQGTSVRAALIVVEVRS